jgi:hypothetical protein
MYIQFADKSESEVYKNAQVPFKGFLHIIWVLKNRLYYCKKDNREMKQKMRSLIEHQEKEIKNLKEERDYWHDKFIMK